MSAGKGQVVELILRDGLRQVRIACPVNPTPSPGQYLLASDGSDLGLPALLFYTHSAPDGFIAAPAPESWIPGREIFLRGPLGRGFTLPQSARKVCLVAFDDSPVRLRGLIPAALKQNAAVTLVSASLAENLPDEIEIQPPSSLVEILAWADYAAFDVARENISDLMKILGGADSSSTMIDEEILVRAPIPCGGIAECGVCAVVTKSGWKMTCKDGPVFKLTAILFLLERGASESLIPDSE